FAGKGSEPRGRRPAIVVQHDRFNRSAIRTTVVAAVTSNLRLGAMPGNVRLRKGEANLPRASVEQRLERSAGSGSPTWRRCDARARTYCRAVPRVASARGSRP